MRFVFPAIVTLLFLAVAPVLAAPILATPVLADDAPPNWPVRPVTIVVPFQAGGSADLVARLAQQQLQQAIGTPFLVENRSGAGGTIGTAYVAKAPADGYTLSLGTVSTNILNEV